VPLLIFTFNPENTVPQRFVDVLTREAAGAGAEVIPVELVASEAAIEARIGSPSRRRDGKTLDVRAYRELRGKGAFGSPVIGRARLTLDTEKMTPEEAAERIAALL
jgi:hypothetical protein